MTSSDSVSVSVRIGFLGLGKMGEALVRGLQNNPPSKKVELLGSTRSTDSALEASKRLSIQVGTDNNTLVKNADVIILGVKPYQAKEVLKAAVPHFTKKQALISICAALTTEDLIEWSDGRVPVIRAMPNTPALIGEGMSVLCKGANASDEQLAMAREIFDRVGKTAVLEESLFDGVTGLSGAGPAYGYLVVEALSEAGVKVGIPRKTATLLAAQTLLGASKMVLSRGDVHPAALKDEVTTPGGCTIDGLMALEEGKLRVTLIKAVLAATRRSKKLR